MNFTRQEKKTMMNNASVLEAALRQIADGKLTQYKPLPPNAEKTAPKDIDYIATYSVIVGMAKSTLAVLEEADK